MQAWQFFTLRNAILYVKKGRTAFPIRCSIMAWVSVKISKLNLCKSRKRNMTIVFTSNTPNFHSSLGGTVASFWPILLLKLMFCCSYPKESRTAKIRYQIIESIADESTRDIVHTRFANSVSNYYRRCYAKKWCTIDLMILRYEARRYVIYE